MVKCLLVICPKLVGLKIVVLDMHNEWYLSFLFYFDSCVIFCIFIADLSDGQVSASSGSNHVSRKIVVFDMYT